MKKKERGAFLGDTGTNGEYIIPCCPPEISRKGGKGKIHLLRVGWRNHGILKNL